MFLDGVSNHFTSDNSWFFAHDSVASGAGKRVGPFNVEIFN